MPSARPSDLGRLSPIGLLDFQSPYGYHMEISSDLRIMCCGFIHHSTDALTYIQTRIDSGGSPTKFVSALLDLQWLQH